MLSLLGGAQIGTHNELYLGASADFKDNGWVYIIVGNYRFYLDSMQLTKQSPSKATTSVLLVEISHVANNLNLDYLSYDNTWNQKLRIGINRMKEQSSYGIELSNLSIQAQWCKTFRPHKYLTHKVNSTKHSMT